jgi:hypothetical protein
VKEKGSRGKAQEESVGFRGSEAVLAEAAAFIAIASTLKGGLNRGHLLV